MPQYKDKHYAYSKEGYKAYEKAMAKDKPLRAKKGGKINSKQARQRAAAAMAKEY